MVATDDRGARRLAGGLALIFATVAALSAVDLVADLGGGTPLRHLLIEGGTVAVGLGGFAWMAARYQTLAGHARALAQRADDLAQRLDASRQEAARWRGDVADLIAGLSAAIDRQLERWALSPAEKEIALLLLKGLSHKEIAEVRKVGEATVRQQARALYKKAGLSGRHDLAAFFLEDLLDPRGGAASSPPG